MKIAQGVTPLRGVYIPHFEQISVKISVSGSYTLTVGPMGVKFGTEEGALPNFTPIGQLFAPAGRKTSKSASE